MTFSFLAVVGEEGHGELQFAALVKAVLNADASRKGACALYCPIIKIFQQHGKQLGTGFLGIGSSR